MNDKIQKRIVYALLFLIVAIIVVAYRFGYMRYTDMADDVKKESKQIKTRIIELNEKIAMRPLYEEAIADSAKRIAEITAKYGPGNSAEKDIMLVRDFETRTKGTVSSASFTDDTIAFVSSGTNENGDPTVSAYTSSLVMNYELDYFGLKRATDFIRKYHERMTVENFTASVNEETGKLTGSMTLNLYAMKTADKIYTDPEIPDIIIGTDNIFGTDDMGTEEAEQQ